VSLERSTLFLVASLSQAAVVFLAERVGLSTLGARATALQLLVHVLAGQLAGYILALALDQSPALKRASIWAVGPVYGALFWWIALSLAAARGTVRAPWTQGAPTVSFTLLAFMVFGVIAAAVVRRTQGVIPDRRNAG